MAGRLVRSLIAYLDTQIVVWLCEKKLERIPPRATAVLEGSDLLISPMVLLELQYLYEIERVIQPPQALRAQLEAQIGLQLCTHPFDAIAGGALFESWTRDPFDRIIVAHARANGCSPLVSSDGKINAHYVNAVWS